MIHERENEERISGLIAETPQENAIMILPGLQYLAREARWGELEDVADILEGAIDEVIGWIRASAH